MYLEKIKKFFFEDKFKEISLASFWFIIAKITNIVIAFIITAWITKFYGTESLGIWTFLNSVLMIASIFALIGTDTYVLRMIPEFLSQYSIATTFKYIVKVVHLIIITGIISSLILYLSGHFIFPHFYKDKNLLNTFIIASLFLIPFSFRKLLTETLRGFQRSISYAFFLFLIRFSTFCILIILTIFSRRFLDAVYAEVFAQTLVCCILIFYLIKFKKENIEQKKDSHLISYKGILSISVPMFLVMSMGQILGQLDILMLGIFKTGKEVGVYGLVIKISLLTSFVLVAINSSVAPKFSELFFNNKVEDLKHIARKSSKLIFWTTSPILIIFIVFGDFFLSLFGTDFLEGYIPLVFLGIGGLINSSCGSVGLLLNMTGHHKFVGYIFTSATILNIILNILLIPSYGIVGAALGSAITTIFWNILASYILYLKMRIRIFYIPFIKN